MGLAADLSAEIVADALPDRPVRAYPALLSTAAEALAWARGGAPEGAVVVSDYQASPRGRAGLEWQTRPGRDLGFSLILRPHLPPEREGWMYTIATSALADVVGEGARIRWPDEVFRDGVRAAAAGVHVELGPDVSEWAVVNVLVSEAAPPRSALMAKVVAALEHRYRSAPPAVLAEYLPRCDTIGRHVRARLIPMGPTGVEVEGAAVGALMDGALLIETARGARVAVLPQKLGLLAEVA